MKLFRLIIAFAFLPMLVQAQTIKLNLVKDAKFEVTSVTKISSVASIMGQEMESLNDMNFVETILVKDTRPGETDLVSTITKIVTNIQAMGQGTAYDSDKKDNTGPAAESFDKLRGKAKNITVDTNGKIIKQDKDDDISSSASMLGISGDGLAYINKIFIGREIKPGATWYDSTTTPGDKIITSTAGNYILQAVNGTTATITFKGITNASGTIEQMGMEMAMTSSSKVTSQFEVDLSTGLIKQSSTNSEGNMNVEASGMSIPVTINTSTTLSVKQL
jgi:hypothetical protein